MKFSGVLFMISCLLLNACPIQSNTCQSAVSPFSISTRRSNTGHWISEVTMNIGSCDKKQNGPLNYNINFASKGCEGKESLQIVADITAAQQKKPAPGYELFPGVGYYKFHSTLKIWSDARKICEAEGGYLAIMNSNSEAIIAKHMFSQHPNLGRFAHIGFYDKTGKGQYVTIFGEPLETTGYAKWAEGEPNNPGAENCGSITRNGTLNDIWCTKEYTFICEYEF